MIAVFWIGNMESIKETLKKRLDSLTTPEPTITIHRGEDFYITDTGSQERKKTTYVKFSVTFREKQLRQLKGAPLAVFICLALHIQEDGTCFPSVSLISRETGYNKDTVFKALKRLELRGYIARQQEKDKKTRRFRSNVYQLFPKSTNLRVKSRV
jgi:DNA-binding MarR family transcriptional regulator